MCQSHTESSDEEDDSHLTMLRRRGAEDQLAYPKLRKSDVRPNLERWERPERIQEGSHEEAKASNLKEDGSGEGRRPEILIS